MTLIDDVLDAVADPDTGLWDALDATYTSAGHVDRATRRNDGSLGAKQVLKRAQVEVKSAQKLSASLDEPFRSLFGALMLCFHELDTYRAAAADESQDRYAADHLDYVEDAARKALAGVLAGAPVEAAVAA